MPPAPEEPVRSRSREPKRRSDEDDVLTVHNFKRLFAEAWAENSQRLQQDVESVKKEVSDLSDRVRVLEVGASPGASDIDSAPAVGPALSVPASAGRGAGPAASRPVLGGGGQASARAMSAPAEPFVPTRLEITNCHDFGRRMEEAMDSKECAGFLTKLVNALPAAVQSHFLPIREQVRRNSRALVFVPVLHVQPGLSAPVRQDIIDRLRLLFDSGMFDRMDRRPRVRWELRADQKPMSRLMGHAYRLTEHVQREAPDLKGPWKVQPAGKGVEVWLCESGLRPRLLCKISESHELSSDLVNPPIPADKLQHLWSAIAAC